MKALVAAVLLAAACAVAWWIWIDGPQPTPAAVPPQPTPAAVPPQSSPPLGPRLVAGEAEVERVCPWPPDPLSWQVFDAACLEAMDAIMMDDLWRRMLDDDHLGTRRAVAEALDRPVCRIPLAFDADGTLMPGEVRADLRETCAAGAMARLAELQALCFQTVHMDLDLRLLMRQSFNDLAYDESPDLGEYHRRERDEAHGAARTYWKVYRCRSVPPEALEWIDALPTPRDMDVYDAAQAVFFNAANVYGRRRSEITQAKYLLEAAHRLGWE